MDRSAEAPLISHQEDADAFDETASQHDHASIDESTDSNAPDEKIGTFMWLLALSAAISGLLFGYDTGVISATLVSLGKSLSGRHLTSLDKSVITSCTSLFALIASPISSVLADRLGRRPVILFADILFIVGAAIQAYSTTVSAMVVGRCVVGAGVGAASFVTPLYIAELAPSAFRGRLVTMNSMSITFGQVVAYFIGWIFAEHGNPRTGWRWMVGLGALPALLQCLLLFAMPETPRWLVKASKPRAARRVIQQTVGQGAVGPATVDRVLDDIQDEVRQEEEDRVRQGGDVKEERTFLEGWRELTTVPKNRRALIIACMLQALQQFCGFNSLMYFSATIFTLLGFSIPTLTSMSVATTNFIFTVAALFLIDRIGRRRILLYSIPFMAVGLFISGFGFESIDIEPSADASDLHGTLSQGTAASVILASMMLYVSSYALGLGNVPWQQAELFALNVRSLGSGLSTATNWAANFIVGLTFLPMMDALTPTWTFVLYGAVCVFTWTVIWMIYPETSGLSLEETSQLLEHGWGVR